MFAKHGGHWARNCHSISLAPFKRCRFLPLGNTLFTLGSKGLLGISRFWNQGDVIALGLSFPMSYPTQKRQRDDRDSPFPSYVY